MTVSVTFCGRCAVPISENRDWDLARADLMAHWLLCAEPDRPMNPTLPVFHVPDVPHRCPSCHADLAILIGKIDHVWCTCGATMVIDPGCKPQIDYA